MRLLVLFGLLLVAMPRTARADYIDLNYMIGPVFGVAWRHGRTTALIGVEGGVGLGPERLNVGITQRDDETFGYIEADPWYFVGGSLGFGIGSRSGLQPVIGVWEGFPLRYPDCGQRDTVVTISAGYRFTGVHELYVAPKAGSDVGGICIH